MYAAPGYPTDPKQDEARKVEAFVNDASVLPWRGSRAFDYDAMNKWLLLQQN